MIRNVVFDMGNVLVRFDPKLFVSRLHVTGEDRGLLLREVFGGPEWIALDRGTVQEGEALADMCRRLPPHLHDCAAELLHWWQELLPIAGMEDLIRELKEKGYGLYVLSNAPVNLHTYYPRIPGAQYMGGLVVSADYNMLKPQRELYQVLFDRYGLRPEACFFIDDTFANVEGAKAAGMAAAVFGGSLKALRAALREAGVHVDIDG